MGGTTGSVASLLAIIGWKSTEARWQAFWDRWSGGQISTRHWRDRNAQKYQLFWADGEMQLDMSYEAGTVAVPETWALRSLILTTPDGRPPSIDWGEGVDAFSTDLDMLEARFGVPSQRYVNGVSFFVSRSDGVELVVGFDWLHGHCGPLRRYSVAALGTPRG